MFNTLRKRLTQNPATGLLTSEAEKMIWLHKYRELIKKFHANSIDFEFCNGYILQATRHGLGAREFQDGLVFYTKKRTGEWVVVSAVGTNRAGNIVETAKSLAVDSGEAVVIKNVDSSLESNLLPICRQYRVDEWWDELAKYDDNTFPELILDTAELVSLTGPTYQSLREEQNRFNKEYGIEVRESKNPDSEKLEPLFKVWIDSMHLRNDWDKDELRASHEMFFNPLEGLFHYEIFDSKADKLIGFLAFSEVSPLCLGYNVLISDFTYRNLYRVLMLKGAEIANHRGYKYLNIQGSEDADQYASKLRLKPEIRTYKEHLIYEAK